VAVPIVVVIIVVLFLVLLRRPLRPWPLLGRHVRLVPAWLNPRLIHSGWQIHARRHYYLRHRGHHVRVVIRLERVLLRKVSSVSRAGGNRRARRWLIERD